MRSRKCDGVQESLCAGLVLAPSYWHLWPPFSCTTMVGRVPPGTKTDRQADRQADRLTATYGYIDRRTDRQADRQIGRQTDR